jgi:hypothetical protein
MLIKILRSHGHCVVKYKEHDTLFDEDEPERLTNEDRLLAQHEVDKGINSYIEPSQQTQPIEDPLLAAMCGKMRGMTPETFSHLYAAKNVMNYLMQNMPPNILGESAKSFDDYFIPLLGVLNYYHFLINYSGNVLLFRNATEMFVCW